MVVCVCVCECSKIAARVHARDDGSAGYSEVDDDASSLDSDRRCVCVFALNKL